MSAYADYETAFAQNVGQFSLNAIYTRNKTVEAIPQNEMTVTAIQEEISKVGVLRELYLQKKEAKAELQKQIDALKTEKKEFETKIKTLGETLVQLREFVFSNAPLQNNDFNKLHEKDNEVMDEYRRLYSEFSISKEQEINELEKNLSSIDDELKILYEFIITGVKDIIPEEKRQSNICTVCIEKTVDQVLTPCGHTFCSGCSSKMSSCALCRQNVKEKLKLYLTT